MVSVFERWKDGRGNSRLKSMPLYLAYKDPWVPWYGRVLAALVVGYAFSPIDLIPDAIPVLGYPDDLVLVVSAYERLPAVFARKRGFHSDSRHTSPE